MAGMSNKISNVLGVPIPPPLKMQLAIRSSKNLGKKDENYFRDNDNLVYLANKTSWVRLVSSINIAGDDFDYFKNTFPDLELKNPEDLAKKFVLFGGTSIYNSGNYNFRSGLGGDSPAYGILGKDEIKQYGYRPMPGINDVKIETQGRLGSIRMATINFKVWDKLQLDIIDALYFKLGYTMFLEWGHTVYYDNNEKLQRSEYKQINPFEDKIKKEKILREIAENIDQTDGNYDAMLGMCTNFNFTYNQEGGFDCTIKLIALGALADSTKLNQTQALPALYKNIIDAFVNKLNDLAKAKAEAEAAKLKAEQDKLNATKNEVKQGDIIQEKSTIKDHFTKKYPTIYKNDSIDNGVILSSLSDDKKAGTFVFTTQQGSTTNNNTKDYRGTGGGV